MDKKRIEYIDAAKAIGIIAVIMGHCACTIGRLPLLGILIVSFHMPLFFIISGFFTKEMQLNIGFRKFSKSYLRPYLVGCIITLFACVAYLLLRGSEFSEVKSGMARVLIASVFGSGSHGRTQCLWSSMPPICNMWFFAALFWACLIYSAAKQYIKGFDLAIFAAFCFFLGEKTADIIRLPFSLQPGLCAIMFLWIGDVLFKQKLLDKIWHLKWQNLIYFFYKTHIE